MLELAPTVPLKRPKGHAVHTVDDSAPVAFDHVPEGQETQATSLPEPATATKVPARQGAQDELELAPIRLL